MGSYFQLTEEQTMLRDTVRRLARERILPVAVEIDRCGIFPQDLYDLFVQYGLPTLAFPERYGGGGGSELDFSIVIEEVARISGAAYMNCGLSHLGAQPILLFGNEDQKQKYLPSICKGRKIAFALTEPDAGSDVGNIKTKAIKDGDRYILNGTKRFISGGKEAELACVFASTNPGAKREGLSCFIVASDTPGYSVGTSEDKMGLRGSSTSELVFEDCVVPAENLIAEEGAGFGIAMAVLNVTRPTVASAAVGIAAGALEIAGNYAKERVQFGAPIASFQGVQFKLAEMAIKVETGRLIACYAASLVDSKSRKLPSISAIAKTYCSDIAMEVTTEAVQVLGGYGYCREYHVERMMRDAKVLQIYEGTNEIQKILIARSVLK
jgi:alkylation response protein AidB-like acyl-CoA dehydrogenase